MNENRGVLRLASYLLTFAQVKLSGLQGLMAMVRSELIQAITDLRKVKSGSIKIKGQEVMAFPRKITEMNAATCLEDRHRDGLVLK